jgi:hypothetical protein
LAFLGVGGLTYIEFFFCIFGVDALGTGMSSSGSLNFYSDISLFLGFFFFFFLFLFLTNNSSIN